MNTDTRKMWFDIFKHLSTISIACILVFIGVYEKGFLPKGSSLAIEALFCGFGMSALGSLFAMIWLGIESYMSKLMPGVWQGMYSIFFLFSLGGLLMGMIAIGIIYV